MKKVYALFLMVFGYGIISLASTKPEAPHKKQFINTEPNACNKIVHLPLEVTICNLQWRFDATEIIER